MAAQLAGVFDNNLQTKINEAKLLVVGAGGIGCEILKNLVLCGFKDIEIIDLDTIDVSNLNRQFLFHKEHVGQSKAEVARKSALGFNPNVEIKAYHDSITTSDYGVNFFKRFKVVLNALDNRQARNHVNRMCLSADVPLIESGTSGYNGQVELIKKNQSQCYECTPKQAQKTFPGCTIRNTPSEPIHCIVWAKHLFNQLFGEDNADEDVSPDTADPEAAGADAGKNALTNDANKEGNVERVSTKKWAKNCEYDPEKMFNKFFHDDIEYLLSMANLWKDRVPPRPIKWGEFSDIVAATQQQQTENNVVHQSLNRNQKIWSLRECGDVFAESIAGLKATFGKLVDGDNLVWDKDDKDAMDFVAACANIRATIFGIAQKSRFEIKSMAGNIIPAIATTNAITAGIVVMRVFRVLMDEYEKCQSVYVRLRPNARNQFMVPDKSLAPPNPKCYVCSPKPEVIICIDTNKATIKYLRDDVLVKALNMVDPDVIIDGKGVIVISSEEGETECNNEKLLKDMSIVDGCILKVDDFFQNYELSVTIVHKDKERNDAVLYDVVADPEVLKEAQSAEMIEAAKRAKITDNTDEGAGPSTSSSKHEQNGNNGESSNNMNIDDDDDDDDVCVVEASADVPTSSAAAEVASSSGAKKRKTAGDEEPLAKRSKTVNNDDEDDDIICIDDDN